MTDQKSINAGLLVLRKIRNSPDPNRAAEIVMEVMERISAGEDSQSIRASYGAEWDKYIVHRQ